MKDPENWMSEIIKNINNLFEGPLSAPMSDQTREDLIDIVADLKDQDPHQYWGERGTDY